MKLPNFILSSMTQSASLAVCLTYLSLLTACSNQLQGVKISTSPELRRASVQVDVIGVSPSNRNAMENVPISKYFQAGNALRKNIQAKSMRFGNAQANAQSLDKNDPVWRGWLDKNRNRLSLWPMFPACLMTSPEKQIPAEKSSLSLEKRPSLA